jgi:predicted GNAT family N-acyltransferase
MKLNLRAIPLHELPLHGHSAIWYETIRTGAESGRSPQHDFHLTLYREAEISAWITLCPTDDSDVLQLCNRYMSDAAEECATMEERALEYVENWARNRGYKRVFINACQTSVPFYLRVGYKPEGEPFFKESVQLLKMGKTL